MEPLSERLDFISSIEVGKLSSVATNRVQTRSFNAVLLNSDAETLQQFDEVFSDPTIRNLVNTIRYDILLPLNSDKRLENKCQGTREAAANAATFTDAMLALFTRLSTWEMWESPGREGIYLYLTATSPSEDVEARTGKIIIKPDRNLYQYLTIDAEVRRLSFIITSGSAAQKSTPGLSIVSHFAARLQGMVRQLAAEMRPLRVNAVTPAYVDTGLWDHMKTQEKEDMVKGVKDAMPTGQLWRVKDVVELYL